ncbi:MAG TPA: STAS/SEC14 domain-containing protein [Cytophagaceae bacterium]|jgi:hypothetical protein|nr:STAS/SEC14 domain-containing protein [Cytophagaceae bacterium]
MKTNTDSYSIYFDEELKAVIMEWDGYSTSNQFREGTEFMLNVLIKNHASKVLADAKDMVMIGMEDQQWMNTEFLPRAINFGFKAIAMIKPDHYFNKVAIESISYKVNKEKLTIRFFDEVEEARQWLKNI